LLEVQNYFQAEMSRYEAFNDVRGTDLSTYDTANKVLDVAEFVYKRAESSARMEGKPSYQAKRYVENKANKVIDEFNKES
jgi:hypothetical protein